MKRITLSPLKYKNTVQIGISFNYDDEIRLHLKELPEIKWSKTHKTFYIPFTTKNKQLVYNHLRLKNWFVDYDALKTIKQAPAETYHIKLPSLSEYQKKDIFKFKKWLQQKRLSTNTVNSYVEVASFFIRYTILKKHN
ncbi:hypothetical protein [Hyunsoonleella flava]|uniref:hypothetical protein n=1 Tax=Hyunsoonleella flava TaxID=2527939 RepID=UPI001F45EF1C|nr:hypothetical protein [Hyunsoonleella flava]